MTAVTTDISAEGSVRTITLSDPDRRNAIGDELRAGLHREVCAAVADEACRAIVLTGAAGAFSAGGELASMPTDEASIRRRLGTLQEIVTMLAGDPRVVLAAVDGPAYGSGLSLAAAADVVVAGEGATFGCTFGRVGLIPDLGFMWSVPRRIGVGRTRLMIVQNAVVKADEAHDWGLVDLLCPTGQALGRATELARRIVRTPAATLAHALRLLTVTSGASLEQTLEAEMTTQIELFARDEFAELRDEFISRTRG